MLQDPLGHWELSDFQGQGLYARMHSPYSAVVCVCAMYTYTCLIDCLIHVVLFFIWRIKYLEVALPLCATFCGKMEEPAAAWPEQFKLSKMWDSCEITRDQMRKQQRLLDWPGAKATGVATKVPQAEQVRCSEDYAGLGGLFRRP